MPAEIRAVVVDDEPLARRRLRTLLAAHPDIELVAECADGPEAVEVIRREHPDLVFLDVQMTELDGFGVVRSLDLTPMPAVVFVTAYSEYAVDAFGVNALDYLLKPFEEERLRATLDRVRGHVTSVRGRRHLTLRVADIEVDVSSREVRRAGEALSLRPKEFDLLVFLMQRAGEVVTRRELLDGVWGYSDDVESRTVDTHLVELRRKLGRAPQQPGYIETLARAGYRMRAMED